MNGTGRRQAPFGNCCDRSRGKGCGKNRPGPRFPAESFAPLFLMVFFILTPGRVRAQETGDYLRETGGEPHFIQRFSWEPEEYASRYEVRIERQESGGNWTRILTELTGGDFIELSLPPGSYRCLVQAHDLMENPAGNPDWIYFEVLPALRPRLESLAPDRIRLDKLGILSGKAALTLTVKGRNLVEGTEFRLVTETGEEILPLQYRPSGNGAVLVFAGEQLAPGNYNLRAVNPGGFSDSLGTLKISPSKKPIVFSVSVGYGPLIPLYGKLNELLEAPAYPAGAYGRIALLPIQTDFADMGVEGAFHWTYIASLYNGGTQVYDVSSHFLGFEAYGLLQKSLNRSMALNFRLGGGLSLILDFEKQALGTGVGKVNALAPTIGGGLSFQWRFVKFFFAELGVEYTHFFSVDNPSPGYLRPVLGIGFSK
jgi:hypothetical protein